MLQSIYWLTSVGHVMQGEFYGDEISIALHMSLDKAIEHAKKYHCKEIYAVTMTNDAIVRLHNYADGYIKEEKLVWTNQSL